MNEVFALVLILLLAGSGYAAGRVHGQFSYRLGFRYGYRQGYFDGDRASWNRRRRELRRPSHRAPNADRRAVEGVPIGCTGGHHVPSLGRRHASTMDTDGEGWDARHATAERGPGGSCWPDPTGHQRTGEADAGALAEAGHAT